MIEVDSIAEMLLTHGCTERQMTAIKEIADEMEKRFTALHLQIVAMRALAHCRQDEQFGRFADAVLKESNESLRWIREQVDPVAGLLGQRVKERLANS